VAIWTKKAKVFEPIVKMISVDMVYLKCQFLALPLARISTKSAAIRKKLFFIRRLAIGFLGPNPKKEEYVDSSLAKFFTWWLRPVPLRRHLPFQGSALLAELPSHA
jgi:hypothetical protein